MLKIKKCDISNICKYEYEINVLINLWTRLNFRKKKQNKIEYVLWYKPMIWERNTNAVHDQSSIDWDNQITV